MSDASARRMGDPSPRIRSRSDTGSITAFAVIAFFALFTVVGIVVDGGSELVARQNALDEAQQAARAGAGALSVPALRSGSVQLDVSQAIAAADGFTAANGHLGTASVIGQEVTVHVGYRIPTSILGIIGIHSLPVSAEASAVDVSGVTRGSS